MDAAEGDDMTNVSSKNAFRTVAPAPEKTACPAGYAGCVGLPSGYAIGSTYVPYLLWTAVSTDESRIS
jgi:hypothetical protein